ncbi:hypothetical protein C0J52_10084 [Blattella germanica]|nr:hypothetical protein C0J52_10084 [Blattella germanica]
MTDARLAQIRGLRVGNLSLVTQEARGEFQLIPLRVEKDTRDARNVTRDLTYKVENGRNQALKIVRGLATFDQWRWSAGLGSALCVLLIWTLLLSGISCGCCGAENRAAPTLLTAVILMSVLSIALWGVALSALLIGGHGEVFICRPLYDEPEYRALTSLVDRPGVLFQNGGGFFFNLLYRNGTIDVLLRDVLQKCKENESTYSTFQLKKVLDLDTASNHRRWDLLHLELSHVHVNLSDFVLLTPVLQQELQDLLHASNVNLSNFRSQMIGQVTAKDLQSFADQMSSVANQITDWSTVNRLENLILNTRNLMTSYIQPLEQRKEDIVYQLTTLEMQLSPLQRQVNQSLSHFKTIQYFINNQGGNIANKKSEEYTSRIIGYMDQYRTHVLNKTHKYVAPCRPVWDLYHAMRLLFCRHIIDPLVKIRT